MTHPEMDWQIHKTSLSSRFKELYTNNQWTDCAFRVGFEHTEILRSHKIVLAASSPVFEALFFGTLAEQNEVIDVPDLEPDTFRLLLKYVYCDSTAVGSIETAAQLLYAAKKYMMPHLARSCLDFLLDNTYIHSLWQVLAVAEDLNEDELITSCIKVMCQYPGEMWVNNNEHVGLSTLSRLLDQPATNLAEVELWRLVAAWARDQCDLRDLSPSPKNCRALLDQTGLLRKVRFLTLSPTELADSVEPSGLLTEEELRALRNALTINTNKLPFETATIPSGFNSNREIRKRFMSVSSRCSRHCLTKRKRYTYGGTIKTTVSADNRIMVTGFEVFTRIASTADYIMNRGSVSHYSENLIMSLYDEEENLINRTEVNNVVVVFNVTHEVSLSKPVWFVPKHRYTVVFELSHGQYPLSDLAPVAYSKSVCFRFNQCEHTQDTTSMDLDVSFINGIFFNV